MAENPKSEAVQDTDSARDLVELYRDHTEIVLIILVTVLGIFALHEQRHVFGESLPDCWTLSGVV